METTEFLWHKGKHYIKWYREGDAIFYFTAGVLFLASRQGVNMKKICVLFGGESNEYEVSLRSAFSVLESIDYQKYIVYKIGITRDGKWLLFNGENEEILNDTWHENRKNIPICVDFSQKSLVAGSVRISPDLALIIMHGEYGEDGRIQGLFELLHIKKLGVSASSASLCMDKHLCKLVAMSECIPVVPYVLLKRRDACYDSLISEIGEEMDVFVKPCTTGSSVGISRVRDKEELKRAIYYALEYSDKVLIERAIDGAECEVAVMEASNELVVSEVGSLSYKSDFYDYETKYNSSTVKYKIPAKIPEECRNLCREYARRLFESLGCSGLCRVDFFVTREGEVFFNEVNALPGFTSGSMFPMLFEGEGYQMMELIDALICQALGG